MLKFSKKPKLTALFFVTNINMADFMIAQLRYKLYQGLIEKIRAASDTCQKRAPNILPPLIQTHSKCFSSK